MTVTWQTFERVSRPRVRIGTCRGGLGVEVEAQTRTYVDALSSLEVWVHSAQLTKLDADRDYIYEVVHDGAQSESGSFKTAPSGRAPFVFTSFGDMGSPSVTVPTHVPGEGPYPSFMSDAIGAPSSYDMVTAIERQDPLFHLINGDLCYAGLSVDRVRVWESWFANIARSSRRRPWMPAPGNHENEKGNGPIGYSAYQTYFSIPPNGGDAETEGLWYAFTVGGVRFICVSNDDVCYQDGGGSYIRGYSGGAQKRWLENELRRSRENPAIDWIVVCMHQVVISTADKFNGADLGVREEWVPLFDRYGVDLVLCGHEHHYERSHPIRGQEGNHTRTPISTSTREDVIETSQGTVHMVLGGGGTSLPSNNLLFDPPQCRVIVGVQSPDRAGGKRAPIYVMESAPWSAIRDRTAPYGFASFTVDPGTRKSGRTNITVTYHQLVGRGGQVQAVDAFTLTRPRGDVGGNLTGYSSAM